MRRKIIVARVAVLSVLGPAALASAGHKMAANGDFMANVAFATLTLTPGGAVDDARRAGG